MKIIVTGGTGLIGSKVVTKLRESGVEAVSASPNSGVNTITGDGLAAVLTGASVVVDVSNSPSLEDAAALAFFETSTRNLLAAEAAEGVRHHYDPRSVVPDLRGRYFGAELGERTLVPDRATLGEISFDDWLSRQSVVAPA